MRSQCTGLTVTEFLIKNGYSDYRLKDRKMQRGYIPKKYRKDLTDCIVYEASGKRKGEYYILYQCYYSNNYIYRYYIEFIK